MKCGLDISIDSTGLCIDGKLYNYTTTKENYKWIKATTNYIVFRFIEINELDNYSENEMYKLKKYNEITDLIIKDIVDNIKDKNEEIIINIEGYNYALSPGKIIDIVTFSTLLRNKIINISNKIKINIVSPKSLKKQLCEKVYGFGELKLGKNGKPLKSQKVSCNLQGIAGGSFKKPEVYRAFIESNIEHKFKNLCIDLKDELLSMSKIVKPFDDVIDAMWLYLY